MALLMLSAFCADCTAQLLLDPTGMSKTRSATFDLMEPQDWAVPGEGQGHMPLSAQGRHCGCVPQMDPGQVLRCKVPPATPPVPRPHAHLHLLPAGALAAFGLRGQGHAVHL